MANSTPKNTPDKANEFWSSLPKPEKKYSNLSEFENQTLTVFAVTDFVGDYSECFVLHAHDQDIPFGEDEAPKEYEILVAKNNDGRNTICEGIRTFLAENTDDTLDIKVKKYGRFYAIEPPTK